MLAGPPPPSRPAVFAVREARGSRTADTTSLVLDSGPGVVEGARAGTGTGVVVRVGACVGTGVGMDVGGCVGAGVGTGVGRMVLTVTPMHAVPPVPSWNFPGAQKSHIRAPLSAENVLALHARHTVCPLSD